MSPIGLVSLLTVLLHYEFLILWIVIYFDFVFDVLWPEQQEMVSMEEIIELQKREEAAQRAVAEKEKRSAQKVDQGAPVPPGQSAAKKSKDKGITVNEGASRATQTVTAENAPQSKKNGKRRVGEQAEASTATRQHTSSGGIVVMVPVFVTEVTDSRLVIHPHPLFGEMVPFKKDAPFSSQRTATLLNSPLYALKLARSVVPVPDR